MQQYHCDGVLSNDWNTLLGEQISHHTAMSMSRSALVMLKEEYRGLVLVAIFYNCKGLYNSCY